MALVALLLGACGPTPSTAKPTVVDPSTSPGGSAGPAGSAPPTGAAEPAPIAMLRDPRPFATQPRPSPRLIGELAQLSTLLSVTPVTAPDRAPIQRRVAETAAELVYAATAEGKAKVAENASKMAIKQYAELHEQLPAYPQDDEVLYFLAFEDARAGLADDSAKNVAALRQLHPGSRFTAMTK